MHIGKRLNTVLNNLTLSQKAFILVIVPLSFELIFLFTLSGLVARADEQARRADRAREIVTHSNNLTNMLYGAGGALFRVRLPLRESEKVAAPVF